MLHIYRKFLLRICRNFSPNELNSPMVFGASQGHQLMHRKGSPVTISSALYIGMAKVLPIIGVLGYNGQNSSFSSSPPCSDSSCHGNVISL